MADCLLCNKLNLNNILFAIKLSIVFFLKLYYLFILLILDSYFTMEIFMKEDGICLNIMERERWSIIQKMEE